MHSLMNTRPLPVKKKETQTHTNLMCSIFNFKSKKAEGPLLLNYTCDLIFCAIQQYNYSAYNPFGLV